ncbi:Probable chromosome-partitioning protein parB [Porphyromonas crevioricanis]|uniref:Probable chromosome-partitioning protein parB n=1 Tax=Porphyromonas crevioricanis TaxID=393921 RepID=A0A2X4PLL8_9PORP|nr:ParB/RepB/Spo0J family partition protein [Porphyromonas crevioricanis]GAD07612.1 chromosome (plasmid) partitioning protein ParB / Stage 0 sporulation protein J [Porphyromonas crevioricanis JCM 13913]SQH73690.1 Probable chromosome-partitioning protein parB [Porphyromonas crevioricanis]
MSKKFPQKALGRGLDSLLQSEPVGSSSISEIEISRIKPNPDQPRRTFDTESLEELAASIKAIGLVQPITLRKVGNMEYLIISGERRWRASQMAGLSTIPAYIRTAEDETIMEMALVENIQREDLNPIEVALAYQNLLEGYHMTHEELGNRLGKKRASISNYLRLLKLPAEVQLGLTQRKVDMGHARALLHLSDPELQIALYAQILERGLSVRQVEEMAREIESGASQPSTTTPKERPANRPHSPFADLANHLSSVFKTDVKVQTTTKGKGKLTIAFDNEEELERIMLLLENISR